MVSDTGEFLSGSRPDTFVRIYDEYPDYLGLSSGVH